MFKLSSSSLFILRIFVHALRLRLCGLMRSRRPPPPPPPPPASPPPAAHKNKNKKSNGRGADGAASNVPFVKVLVALIIIRAIPSSFLNGIHDCDETYNYWEPLMHITAGDDAEESANSRALQTWEYAPENALRSYLFLWLAGWPAALLPPSRVAFHAVRLHLAFWASFAEAMLITACYRRFGRIVGSNAYFLFLISGGLFTSTTQLLPGTLTALGFTAATALAIERKPLGVIACVAVGSILGWPVALPAAVPLALLVLIDCPSRSLVSKVVVGLVASFASIASTFAVDAHYYGFKSLQPTSITPFSHLSPLNLLAYNFLGGASDLYGVEGALYYVRNAILQLNVLFPLAFVSPLVVAFAARRVDALGALAAAVPFPLWFALLSRLPHKEERFLYVVYPAAHVGGALTLALLPDAVSGILPSTWRKLRYACRMLASVAGAVLLIAFAVLSVSRVVALRLHYGSAVDLYAYMPSGATGNVCVHTEWHTFPSSLHLPERAQLAFLPMPGGAKGPLMPLRFEGTSTVGRPFNRNNEETPEQYIDSPSSCAYFVVRAKDGVEAADAVMAAGARKPRKLLASLPYANAAQSPSWARGWFLPGGLTEKRIVWDKYVLFEM